MRRLSALVALVLALLLMVGVCWGVNVEVEVNVDGGGSTVKSTVQGQLEGDLTLQGSGVASIKPSISETQTLTGTYNPTSVSVEHSLKGVYGEASKYVVESSLSLEHKGGVVDSKVEVNGDPSIAKVRYGVYVEQDIGTWPQLGVGWGVKVDSSGRGYVENTLTATACYLTIGNTRVQGDVEVEVNGEDLWFNNGFKAYSQVVTWSSRYSVDVGEAEIKAKVLTNKGGSMGVKGHQAGLNHKLLETKVERFTASQEGNPWWLWQLEVSSHTVNGDSDHDSLWQWREDNLEASIQAYVDNHQTEASIDQLS